MDNMKTEEAADKMLLNSKLRSPNPVADPHTMDSIQDGGQANVKMERNDFQAMAPLDGSTMNADMNSYPPNPRDPGMSGDNYDRMNDTMAPGPMQGYAGYNNRANYMGEPQHGAATGNADSQYHGYYPQPPGMRPGFTGTPKAGMNPVRPGMGGMVSPGYPGSAPPRGMVSGQTISQQSGPTPTLNQLLQNQNSTPRSRNYYGDYGGGVPQKPTPGDMPGSYGMQPGWVPPRGMEPYPQGQMPGSNQYRSQGSPMPEMKRQSGSGNMPPNYSHQQGSYPTPQFSPNSQRYNLAHGQSRSGQSINQQMPPQYGQNQVPNFSGPQMPPSQGFMGQHSSPQHQGPGSSPQQGSQGPPPSFMQQNQQASPQGISRCSSGSKRPSEDGDSTVDGGFDDVNSDNSRGTPTSSGIHHPAVSSLRPVTSPVGSTGSRSNTPASIPGTQASSPMPPRPPSRQHDGQSRMTQSPMTTQGNYHRQQAMPSAMQGPPGMQGYSQQNLYNGPMMVNPMHNSSMYNSAPMNRGVPAGYAGGFSQGNNMSMASQYGSYNSHGMVPQGGMGSAGMGPMTPQQHGGMNSQGGPGAMPQHGATNSQTGGAAMAPHHAGMNSPHHAGMNSQGGAPLTPISSNVGGGPQQSSMNSQSGVGSTSHQPATLNSHVGPPQNAMNSSGPMPSHPPSNAMRSGRISPSNIMNSPAGGGGGGGMHHHQQQQAIMNSQGGVNANACSPMNNTGSVDGGTGPPAKRAQAAADAAMMAAANSTNRAPAFNRPANHVRMYGGPSPGAGPLSPMGAMAQMGQQTNMNSAPSSVNMPPSSSMPHSPVPNSLASSHMSTMPPSNSNANIPPLVSSSSVSNSIVSTANSSMFSASGNGSMSSSSTLSYPSGDTPNPDANSQDSSDFGPAATETKCMNSGAPTVMTNHVSTPTSPGSSMLDKHEAMMTDDADQSRGSNAQEGGDEHSMPNKMLSDDENSQSITTDMAVSTSGNTITVVTQCFSTPVVSISETRGCPDAMAPECMSHPMSTTSMAPIVSSVVAPSPVTTPIPVPMMNSIDEPPAEKKKKASGKGTAGDVSKLFEMGNEMERRPFLEKLMYYLEERGTPLTAMPAISKQPLDLFKLYLQVQGRGGMVEVTKAKKWKEICGIVNIGCSASAAFTLKKNYIKYMFSYECKYERGGIDPQPILAQMEATLAQKRESKRSRAPSPGSQSSQDTFRPPSTPSNSNSQGLDPFSPGMQPHYMQNEGGMGPMPGGGGMMPPNSMMNPPNAMMGGNMGHHHMPGHMMQPSPMMGGGGNSYMGSNNMMGNSMGPPNSNMMPSGNPPMMPGANNPMMQSGNAPMLQSGNVPMMQGGNTTMMPSGNATMMPSGNASMMPSGNASMMPSGSATMMPTGNASMMPSGNSSMMPSGSASMMPGGNASMMPGNSAMLPGSNNAMIPSNSSSMMANNSGPMISSNNNAMMTNNSSAMMGSSGSSSSMGNANSNTMSSTNSAMLTNNSSAMAGNSVPNDSNSVSVQDPFADEPSSTSNFSRQNLSNQFSGMPSQSNMSNNFNYGGNRPSNAGSHFPSMNQNNSSSFSEGNSRMPSPGGDQFPDNFPRRPQMSGDNFGNTNSNNSSSPYPARSGQAPQQQGQFPYGQQFDRERFEQPTPGTPNQAYRHPPQPSPDQSYPNRYGNIRPSTPQQSDQSFPNQSSFSPPANRMMMPEQPYGYPNQQQGAYPSPRPPMKMEGGASMNTPNKWYPPEGDRRDGFNMPPAYSPHAPPYGDKGTPGPMPYPTHRDNSMNADLMPPDSRREPVPWPQRYPVGHAGPNMPPSGPPMGAYTNRSMSQRMSPSKMGKSCLMHNSQFPPKKELVFSPHTVEGVQPLLARRRRITSKDIGPLEAWRIMMSLKSGLLAESTWALDTLTILLFDDYTLPYFNLNSLPGLLETLLEHFRRHLIDMFGLFEEMEVHKGSCHSDSMLDSSVDSDQLNNCSDCTEDYADKPCEDNNKKQPFTNYTHITRQGRTVTVEEQSEDCGLLDEKEWDIYTGFATQTQHWRLGGGDMSNHILTHFECINNKEMFRSLFFKRKRKLESDNENEEVPQIKKEHSECDEDSGLAECTEKELCSPSKPSDIVMETEKNCECESSDNCNNYMKSEPRENEHDKADSEDSQSTLVLPQVKSEESSTEPEEKTEDDITEDKQSPTAASVVCNETAPKTPSLGQEDGIEDEAYKKDNSPLYLVPESREEIGRRCVCISNIFRSLSCLPGNELEMSRHPGLLKILGKLLLLHHRHVPRPRLRQSFDREEPEVEDSGPYDADASEDTEWWWDSLNHLRENTLVIIANISGHLDISKYPEEVCHPLLDGLLHWAVCPSSCAQDPLPTMSSNSVLTPQRLVLESLCKLSILEDNVDLILATPPFDRILQLFEKLTKLLANKKQQVPQEFAIVLLSALVQGSDCAARAVALQHPFISLLIDFLETAEQAAVQVANSHGIHMLRDSPELMGTSLDMLRRAASILVHLSRVPENRTLFLHQQSRLLSLVMSQILDQHVAQLLSDVLYECCNSNS